MTDHDHITRRECPHCAGAVRDTFASLASKRHSAIGAAIAALRAAADNLKAMDRRCQVSTKKDKAP